LIYEYYILRNNEKAKQMIEDEIMRVKDQDKKCHILFHYAIMNKNNTGKSIFLLEKVRM
jgi:hypothetical protein